MREPIRKSPRKPKPISFFHEEQANMEQHLKSPSKRQSSPSKKSPKKSPPKNAVKKQLTGKFKYRTLVSKAMMAMGRNSAHSLPAILKYIQSNYQIDRDEATIKRFVKSTLNVGPFTKIGGSYKLRPEKSAPRKKTPAQKKKQPESEEEEEEDEEEEKEEVKKSPRKRKAAEDKKPEEEQSEKKKRSPRKKKEESKEDEEPKKKRSPRKKKEEKEDDEEPKKKRTPKKKKEEEKEEDENGNNSNNNNNKRKKTPKKSAPIKDKELIVPDVLPDVTTSGIVFNTTDLPEVRADIKQTIDSLLTDDNVRVGIVANRGWKDAAYNLELLEFTDDSKKIQDFVENSFGEGRDWLSYYKQVMQDCLNFGWGVNKTKTLVLIGDEGVNAVRDPSLQAEIGKLTQLGVRVYAFHHSQLFLLSSVLSDLN